MTSLDDLQLHCNSILDDFSIPEEDRIEKTEDFVRDAFQNDNIAENDLERLILDILWRHREGGRVPKSKKPVAVARVSIEPPTVLDTPELKLSDLSLLDEGTEVKQHKDDNNEGTYFETEADKNTLNIDWEDWELAEDDYGNSMSSFDILRSILGEHIQPEDIHTLLEKYDFNVSRVLESLFDNSSTKGKDESSEDEDGHSRRELCKYFAQYGECLRADCMYSHDLSARICKFWLRGACLAEETCTFLHEIPEEIIEKHIPRVEEPPAVPTKLDLKSEDAFPTLGQPKKKNNKAEAAQGSVWSTTGSRAASSNVDADTPSTKTPSTKPSPASGPKKFAFNPSSAFKFQPGASKAYIRAEKPIPITVPVSDLLNRGKVQLKRPSTIPWESPDSEPNKAYISLRNAAAKHADLRNKYLELGAKSWYRNEAGTAKMMSVKGQKHNEQMTEKYDEAAEFLFERRKEKDSEVFADLHGLELEKVTHKLQEYMDIVEEEDKENPRPLYAICGYGRYYKINPTREDKMTQTIKDYLKRKGYKFTDYNTAEKKYGKIIAIDVWSSR